MTDFATLVLAADTRQMAQAERAIDRVTKSGQQAENQVNKTGRAIDHMDKMARRAAIGAGVLVTAAVGLTRSSMNQIDALTKQARQVGLLTRDFQAMSLVAEEAGVSTSNLTNMIGLMQRNIVELSRGSANQTRAFHQLGLSLRDLQGLSPDRQFERIATALSGVEDPAQRTALAMEVFGRSGREAINMLDGYTDALDDARRFQEAFGLAVSQDAAQGIERANDAIGRLTSGFRGLGNLLAAELAPRMERFANSMIETIIQTNAIQRTASVLVALFDRIGFYAGAAAVAFGAYKVAAIAATVATVGFSTALGVARAALIRLGLGVIIVAAGELAFRVSKLIEATGGWGNAFSLLGDVASGVWQGISTSAKAMWPALKAVWEGIKSDFYSLVADMLWSWSNAISKIADGAGAIGLDKIASKLANAAADAQEASNNWLQSALDATSAASKFRNEASKMASEGFDKAREALKKLNTTVETNTENTEDGTDAANALNTALENVTDTTGGAAGAVGKLSEELQQVPQWVNGVSDAFADLVMRGFQDFRSFAQSVVNTFRNMLRDMIALAARNRIMISLGMGGMATPAMAGTGLPGVSGLVGSFGTGSGLAGFAGGTGFLGGMGNVIGGFAGGGFAGAGSAISTAMTGATGSLAGFAAAAGAIALPLAAAAALFSFFGSKTTELDRGLIVTAKNMDTLVQSFRTVERSRFWGLSKSVSTTLENASDEIANPIIGAVSRMQQIALDAANVLGIGAEAFENFSYRINLSLKGLNEQQAMQKVTEELSKMGDAFASLAPGVSNMNELLGAAQQRYDLTTRLLQLQGEEEELLRRHREQELSAVHDLNREILLQIYSLEDQAIAAEKASIAAQQRIFIESQLARERDAIERRALELQGDTAALRERELAALDPTNRALLELIFALEDTQRAAQNAARAAEELAARQRTVAQERFNLETRLLQVQGDTAALRERELDALDPVNRDILETIFAIEDAQRAAAEAQRQAEERAREQERIAQERFNLETKILQLQGNTAALRERELAALDPSNRALQKFIFGLEDAAAALNALSPSDFATAIDFERAQAQARIAIGRTPSFANGGVHRGGLRLVGESGPELEVTGPSNIFSHGDTMAMLSNKPMVAELRELRQEVARMRDEQRQLGIQTATSTDRSYRLLRSWDVVGLPEERTA